MKPDIKLIGLRAADDIFKEASPVLADTEKEQDKVEAAWSDLQDECGLQHTANMKQCLRVAISRYMATPDTSRLTIQEENGVCIKFSCVFQTTGDNPWKSLTYCTRY